MSPTANLFESTHGGFIISSGRIEQREEQRRRVVLPTSPTSSSLFFSGEARSLLRSTAAMASTFSGDETAPFFGFLGAAAALVFSCKRASFPSPPPRPDQIGTRSLTPYFSAGMGAAYGTAKSGVGVASMGVMRPELVMKSIVPVVMAGVLGIYGLIIAVIISTGINPKAKPYFLFDGYAHLSSGLACGLAGLAAGMAIGIVGDAGVRANAQQPKLFVGMILILIFAEALALYGLIVGIILSSRAGQSRAD
ncbi:hypothetical protein PR202_ga10938 [Eleusine coracana subsp. coracana]|uniref:V-type proton ATPase proteolipid subunit n=4 Tax=Poaceae TaxID=4479 RepID=A0AAV5C809_ELECO|nr:hypothetical protein PR202_ga10938 [Eleusine coracana subsp. coracana]